MVPPELWWLILTIILDTRGAIGDMEGKIVGGKYVSIYEAPHSVFINVKGEKPWCCGGSILNQWLVLTAAHCLDDVRRGSQVEIYAGDSNTNNMKVIRKVKRYVFHGNYDRQTDFCDIAVCQLEGKLPLSRKIQRVIIKTNIPIGTTGEVAGWGVTNDYNAKSPKLKKVQQVVRPLEQCSHLKLRAGMMCVSSGSKREYPAMGDSGSALVTNACQQIGIVSFKGDHKKASTIVYTNVSFFYDWIQYQSKRLWCSGKKL